MFGHALSRRFVESCESSLGIVREDNCISSMQCGFQVVQVIIDEIFHCASREMYLHRRSALFKCIPCKNSSFAVPCAQFTETRNGSRAIFIAATQESAINLRRPFWKAEDVQIRKSFESIWQASDDHCLWWAGVLPIKILKSDRNRQFRLLDLYRRRHCWPSRRKLCLLFLKNVYLRLSWFMRCPSVFESESGTEIKVV